MSLTFGALELPTAPLGPPNPLPPLDAFPLAATLADDIPATIVERSAAGAPPTMLPYLTLDDYDRRLVPHRHPVAVLDDGRLRATFALGLGGRLLSLRDLVADRKLLYVNPVLQPANLSLRNAWFSGGLEFNIGTRGHSPTTMDPLHAARAVAADGGPALRMWEYERTRGVVFQIDAWLPADANALALRVAIRNVGAVGTPMYWWSNLAVPCTDHTRVLADAERAFRTDYPNRLVVSAVPGEDGRDTTWPGRNREAADFFYDLDGASLPWIAAVEGDGTGVAHASTPELGGRKLFVWGATAGGRRWQRWLSHDDPVDYAEIQGGITPTQLEHTALEAGAELSWIELLTPLAVGPGYVDDVITADTVADVGNLVAERSAAVLAARLAADEAAARAPIEVVAHGSGWGALERRRRLAAGEPTLDDSATPFGDETLGSEQAPWLELLETGMLPIAEVAVAPTAYVIGADWERRLAVAAQHWLTAYHLATIAHGRGDRAAAGDRYAQSLAAAPNAWARRGLARLRAHEGKTLEAAQLAEAAVADQPGEWHLLAEAAAAWLAADQPQRADELLAGADSAVRHRPRLRMLRAWAAVEAGRRDEAAAILSDGELEVPDLREGERSLDELWGRVFPGVDLPACYDFRMATEDRVAT